DWDPITPELKGRILLPILEDGYGEVLDRGELRLVFDKGELQVQYYDRRLPIEPGSALAILKEAFAELGDNGSEDANDVREMSDILASLEQLPPLSTRDPDQQRVRHERTEDARRRFQALAERSARVRGSIESTVAHRNGTPGQSGTFDRLH